MKQADEMPKRHYILGDIHGCYQTLLGLEKKIIKNSQFYKTKPIIISVGDLIDRGPDSASVVRHFQEGAAAGTHKCLLGNHELWFLKILVDWAPWNFDSIPAHLEAFSEIYDVKYATQELVEFTREDYVNLQKLTWIAQGGSQTLWSFGFDPKKPKTWKMDKGTMKFLCELPVFVDGPGFVASHSFMTEEDFAVARTWEKGLPSDATDKAFWRILHGRTPPPLRFEEGERIHISGHTPLNKAKRIHASGCIQIDTGCTFGGKLTAYCVESDRLLSLLNAEHAV